MANGGHVGISNVARKVKSVFVGVAGVARRVKSAYVGVSNVARRWLYHKAELVQGLSVGRQYLAAAPVGDYALFGGGFTVNTSASTNAVDAYDRYLVRKTPAGLITARARLSAAATGDHAIFSSGDCANTTMDAYNRNLTRTNPFSQSHTYWRRGAASINDIALFAGGEYSSTDYSSGVEAINKNLTYSTATPLSVSRAYLTGVSNGKHALFAGGEKG